MSCIITAHILTLIGQKWRIFTCRLFQTTPSFERLWCNPLTVCSLDTNSPEVIFNYSKTASQPQWQSDSQLSAIANNFSCPTGQGMIGCLREKDGNALRRVLLDTGVQFQPVIDNITIFKDYVMQTRQGRTAKVPLLIGTNKVCTRSYMKEQKCWVFPEGRRNTNS